LSSLPTPVDDDSQQSSSSLFPVDTSNDENRTEPTIPLLLSDSETLDEGFETQSNVSETVEPTPRSCPLETTSNETDETLADELTRRLTFNSTRRLSHDSSTSRNNNKRTSLSIGRPPSLLKTSTSAYSYPTFTSTGQQNQQNNTFTKRTPSVESLRSTSTNNNAAIAIRSSRHIQRCAVSRRIWTEKGTDETSKTLHTSPPPPPSTVSVPQVSIEPDEISSSSTVTTTTTITTTTKTTTRRLASSKPKNKIRNPHSLTDSSSCSNSPVLRKIPSRLGHASSCQNVSTATINSPKSSPLTKTRSPPSFFLNSSQILRSALSRSTEKPLRAFHMSTTMPNESQSPSSRARRLFSSSSDIESTSISSPRTTRKPPSSWHHQKPLTNKTTLPTVLSSSSFASNRKTSLSTTDLRKTNPLNNSVFQRLTQSKRL
jgi:hypothetical protein